MSQLFIATVGHNGSGKTTVAQRLAEDLSLNRVNGDDLRTFLFERMPYFADVDLSYPSSKYDELNPLIMDYRFRLSKILLQAGQHVLYDGSGSTRAFRDKYLATYKREFPAITTVIIYTDIGEPELLERLDQRGDRWLDMYHDWKKAAFEAPTADEADVLLRYNQQNYDEIKQSLVDLL